MLSVDADMLGDFVVFACANWSNNLVLNEEGYEIDLQIKAK